MVLAGETMILTQQVGELCSDISGDIIKGQAGTDSTLFVNTQTGLLSAVSATNVNLNDNTFTTFKVAATHIITTSLGNGNNLVEFEVNNGTISYNRSVKAPFDKTASNELNIFHSFEFQVTV